jgi:ATP-dependent DNA helicase DinG
MISVFDSSHQAPLQPPLAQRMFQAFSTDGKLAASPQFEYRPQQQRMAELVGVALEKSQPLIVEAATGVGKSLAYLLPAVTHALEKEKKAIICTHTINLQEQLVHKDLPIIKKVVGDFHAELLKGRNNYLCPTRLRQAFSQSGDLFSSSEAAELQMVLDWNVENPTGTLSEMPFSPGARLWSMIRSEPHACTPRRCPPGSGCVYQDVRRRMAAADILVLNHTLFFTLLASAEELLTEDANFLFPRDFVVLDEAHTLENIAAQAFGIHVMESSMRFELGRLFNPKTKKGFLVGAGDQDGIREVQHTLGALEIFFRSAEAACKFTGAYSKEFRIREPGLVENTLALPLQRVAGQAQKAADAAKSEGQKLELQDICKRLTALRVDLSAFLDQTADGHVYWAERVGVENRQLALHSAPIDVAPKLNEIFFSRGKGCVFTSATLSVGDDEQLGYFRRRVGGETARAVSIESPFDFKSQMKLYVVKQMPQPSEASYADALSARIQHFLQLSQGRAFVLFTSYSQLTQVAERVERFCEKNQWQLLVQGRGMPRHQMLAEFKKDTNSILFGTDSFWTGVDVPGESLSNVIITRLPFAVPDHPLVASRLEHLEEQGLNSFTEYSVPEAILKLRQGVGRLIRTRKDRGMVVILDNRILTKPYGRAFMASLPDCPVEIVP